LKASERLKIVERDLHDARQKLSVQTKMLSVKKKTERELQGMALEIQYLKEQRVRLCRRKSKEMETYRLRADATRREIARLQKRRRTQEIEYIQLKELHEKQSNVLRRKTKVRFLFF